MWYYQDGENERGPVSKEDLKGLLREKKIDGNTLLRSSQSATWQPLNALVKKKPASPPSAMPKPGPAADTPASVTEPGAPPPPPQPPAQPRRAASPAASAPTRIAFRFGGTGQEYFKIWLVNIVLSVLTLGIYSAWAKVRRKQYFYGNTSVDGAAFSYLANPVTILKGRLIVFAAFVIYSVTNEFLPYAGLALLLLMLPLLPWFVIRSHAFNARNSAIRNIRFTFRGTYLQACKVYLFWPLLLPLTLGVIYPYIYFRQKQFLVDNATFGTTPVQFEAGPKDYYRIFLGLLLPFFGTILVSIIISFLFPPLSLLFWAVFYLYAFAYLSVKANNLLYNSSRLAAHRFTSSMKVLPYLGIIITNTVATVFTLGLFHPFAQVRAYHYQINHLQMIATGSLDDFSAAEQERVNALGDEAAEFMDFDFGL